MSPPSDLLQHALAAMKNAYTPYSHFKVGACIRTSDDQLFSGCNVENAVYNLGLCAESGAITQMVSNGYYEIQEILITASSTDICTPCGACRQRICELAAKETLIHLHTSTGEYKCLTPSDLLPYAFNKQILES